MKFKNCHTPFIAVALLLTVWLLAGCTRNNGDIGPIFGRWSLKSIDATNMQAPVYEGDLFLAFQNDVVQMIQTGDENRADATYGSFRLDDNTLFLEFNDPQRPVNPAFGLPATCRLQVLELTGHSLVLQYNPTDEAYLTYNFRKW